MKVLLIVENGMVQAVYATGEVEVEVIDKDVLDREIEAYSCYVNVVTDEEYEDQVKSETEA